MDTFLTNLFDVLKIVAAVVLADFLLTWLKSKRKKQVTVNVATSKEPLSVFDIQAARKRLRQMPALDWDAKARERIAAGLEGGPVKAKKKRKRGK